MNSLRQPILILLAALVVAACQRPGSEPAERSDSRTATESAPQRVEAERPPAEGDTDESPDGAETSSAVSASAGKPSAPITIDYTVIGTPVVGQPVNIDLEVSSSLGNRPVTLNYRINDARNLVFPQAQPQRVALAARTDTGRAVQQVTVVPQREGRLYLNVSAEVETDEGMLMKSMAIPIQVGSAPEQPATNGELREGADGEAVISMPADETTR